MTISTGLRSTSLKEGRQPRIHRRRLAGQARDALDRGSLIVLAPAGYGKTTLLDDALTRRPRATWVRCTARERDAGHLVSVIISAIRATVPGAAESIGEALTGLQEAVEPIAALRALEAELDRLLVDRVLVVIDDAENLAGARGSCAVMAHLLRHAQGPLGVAVLSRRGLGLRVAKPRVSGLLVELGAADLVFDANECADYVRQASGREPSPEELDRLLAATEGWPQGVATIMLLGGGNGAGDASAMQDMRSPDQLKAYLREEVLDALDASTRRDLLASAVPQYLTPAIVAGLGLPDDFLSSVRAQGLFLRRVDRPGGRMGYHPLFRELLLERLGAELDRNHVAEFHRRVAPVLDGEGDATGAIDHWMAAGDWPEALAAIAREARSLVVTSPGLMRAWLDRFPAELRRAPIVRLLEGHLSWAAGRYEEATRLLRGACERGALSGDPAGEWWGRFLLVDCLNMIGRRAEAARLGEGFDRPEAQEAGVIATATGLYAAHTLASMGRIDEAERISEATRRLPEQEVVAPIDAVLRAYIDLPAGRLDEALERGTAALALVEDSDPLLLRLNVMATIATVLGEQGRFGESLRWWRRQRVEGEAMLMAARCRVVRGLQAQLLAQMGRLREAEADLASHEPTGTWADMPAHLARSLVAAGRGDGEAALAAGAKALAVAETAPPIYRFWALVGVAPAFVRVGRLDRARELVGAAGDLVEATFPGDHGRYLRARTLVLEGWLGAEQGAGYGSGRLVEGLLEAGDAAPHLLRLEWDRIEPLLAPALSDERLEVSTVVDWLWEAFPDGRALVRLADHPRHEIRRASFRAALSSGHPEAKASVAAAACADDEPDVAAAARGALERVASDPPARIFKTLGGFGVRIGGWHIDARDWSRPIDARLVRYLLVHGWEPVAEDVLIETFWPGLPPERGRRSLHVAASRARAMLDHPGTSTVIEAVSGWYRLRLRDRDVVDWHEFEAAASTALERSRPDQSLLQRARSLWGGDPLPRERYSDWAMVWRERMRGLYTEVLEHVVSAHDGHGELAAAIGAAREMVGIDPLNEAAHRSLMSLLARAGRRGQALRQYHACRRALLSELDVEPTESTSALHSRILAGADA